jgi:hypothetical protein
LPVPGAPAIQMQRIGTQLDFVDKPLATNHSILTHWLLAFDVLLFQHEHLFN